MPLGQKPLLNPTSSGGGEPLDEGECGGCISGACMAECCREKVFVHLITISKQSSYSEVVQ